MYQLIKIIILFTVNFSFLYPQPVKQRFDQLLNDDFFESASIAVDVYDLTTRESLYQLNHKKLLHPASNMKLLTSVSALLFLGADYQFITSVYYDGTIYNNTLHGNIYIEGGCDPELSTEDITILAGMIKDLNINSIRGNIYADLTFKDSVYWGVGWMWDDDPSTDAPYLSALNINGNSVGVNVAGTNIGQKAEVMLTPLSEYFVINNKTRTVLHNSEENYFISRNWMNRSNEILAVGNVSLEKSVDSTFDKQLNIINPELYFLTLFKEELLRSGISITGELAVSNLPSINIYIGSTTTELIDVLKNVNKNSNNLSAEMLLYAIAEKYSGRPASAKNGIKIIWDLIRLCGHNPDLFRIVDGSGVSHYNLVSAELIVDILKHIYEYQPAIFNILYHTLPIAGVDGTLSQRMKISSAFNNVRAKTGTLSGVSALSGYVTAANGNVLAFSILIQNHVNQTARARYFQDEICKILAEYR